jgi:hypothetical protein
MKIKFLFIFILFVSACSSTESNQPAISTIELPQGQGSLPSTEGQVPRVTVEDAKAAVDNGEAIIVDVRGPDAYADAHIADSVSIPLGLVESDPANLELDKDQWIITYCT